MSSEFTTSNNGFFTLSAPKYRCPKHGVFEGGSLQLWGPKGEKAGDFCLLCYKDWIRSNIPAVTPEPCDAGPDEVRVQARERGLFV